MSRDQITHDAEQHQHEQRSDEPIVEAAKTTGRALLWVVLAVAVLVVIVGVFLLGPVGLFIVVPAVLAVWFAAAAAAGGPASGA
jgi:uncharacterized membrane protein